MLVSGATPLIAIHASAIDVETTGLDVTKARIVQLGAIRLTRGKLAHDSGLDLLVDPGEPIPPAASRIHGITDAAVHGAPKFGGAWTRLREMTEDRIFLGHSIGFDLAVLEHECRRFGIPWLKPRSLCVRLLADVANPTLPDQSLETIAAWLGVEIQGRHSAIGDATAAGQIFIALLPVLRSRGIRTLGEAELACLSLVNELEGGRRAGWAEPVSRPRAPAFQAVDPYAYRHRVADLTSRTPTVVRSIEPARRIIDLMVRRKISSVFVSEMGTHGHPVAEYGIVTERDILRRISTDGDEALLLNIGSLATSPLIGIRSTAFVYKAIGRMDRLKIRHLAVIDDHGILVGVLSIRDLLRLRAAFAVSLDDAIEYANDAAEMASAWATLPDMARSLLADELDARVVAEIISDEICAVTRRAAVLAERDMQNEGHGRPPCNYALLVLGSGGRGESLLAADQDNAIVFAYGDPDGPEDRYFGRLGVKLAGLLDTAGVPFCKGGVMASKANFRGSLDLWKLRVDNWVSRSRPSDLLNVDIVYDLRPVHGDLSLGEELRDYAYERGHSQPIFAKLLAEHLPLPSSFKYLGGLRLEEGRLDIKRHGLFPIVAGARALAIRHDIRAHSTRGRLEGLTALEIGSEGDMKAMIEGHRFLLGVLLTQQIDDLYSGVQVSNRVVYAALSRDQQTELKIILKRLESMPVLVRELMFS